MKADWDTILSTLRSNRTSLLTPTCTHPWCLQLWAAQVDPSVLATLPTGI